jgi:hypothetical protein
MAQLFQMSADRHNLLATSAWQRFRLLPHIEDTIFERGATYAGTNQLADYPVRGKAIILLYFEGRPTFVWFSRLECLPRRPGKRDEQLSSQ